MILIQMKQGLRYYVGFGTPRGASVDGDLLNSPGFLWNRYGFFREIVNEKIITFFLFWKMLQNSNLISPWALGKLNDPVPAFSQHFSESLQSMGFSRATWPFLKEIPAPFPLRPIGSVPMHKRGCFELIVINGKTTTDRGRATSCPV